MFDTDKVETEHLKKNIELLKTRCSMVDVKTITQVLNFENEIERATDVSLAQELTKSQSVSDFKSAVNRMKEAEFRNTLKRHKLDITKLWSEKPPKGFEFVTQDAEKIKVKTNNLRRSSKSDHAGHQSTTISPTVSVFIKRRRSAGMRRVRGKFL